MSEPNRPLGERRGGTSARYVAVAAVCAGVLMAAGCGGDSTTGPNGGDDGDDGTIDLAVGESQVVEGGSDGLSFALPGPGDDGAEYRLAVQSAATSAGATAMRLTLDGGSSSSVSARTDAPVRPIRGDAVDDPQGRLIRRQLQESTLEMLVREGIRPSDGRRDARTRSMLPTGEEPQPGDELKFWFPEIRSNGTVSCDTAQADTVTATVQAVGDRAAMVEGNEVDDGTLDDMDYQALADEFDNTVFGVDVAYFGSPSDIDSNQRVLVLFTNKVNEFSAERTNGDDRSLVSGFFLGTDLSDSGDDTKGGAGAVCPASNEAEVLWLIAPDPDGSTGEQEIDVAQATRLARSTSSHEFQHLLNLANRLFKGGGSFADAEETWLDEGLSHLAEEIVGLATEGDALRQNLDLSDVAGTEAEAETFNTFLIADFGNLARNLKAPATTPALAAQPPSESQSSLRMRGNAWMFLRWLSDREHAGEAGSVPGAGDPEEGFFQELAGEDGSLETGVDNVETVTGRSWPSLLADFGLAMAVDDDEPQAPDRQQVLTWNLREVYRQLREATNGSSPFEREYPLVPTGNDFSPATFDFSAEAGTGRYFTLSSSGSAPGVTLEVTDQTGSPLTSGSPQVTIIRTD